MNTYKNETESPQKICLFNSMFDRGMLIKVEPNQVITSCEHCSQTIVQDFSEAQALHVGKDIEDTSVMLPMLTPARVERERIDSI